jgi:hypothetical protein
MLFSENPGMQGPPSASYLELFADNYFQTLKERFAEQLPEKIEQIKKLRK